MTINFQNNTLPKINKLLILAFVLLTFGLTTSCKEDESSTNGEAVVESSTNEVGYEDGTYCAQVEYYNPNTGTRSTNTLNVEVENNELVLIHWPNGGWLDESHFIPVELDESGYCTFTSDKGYEYRITIKGPPCSKVSEINSSEILNEEQRSGTLWDCATKHGITELELSEVERLLNISRLDKISSKRCEDIIKYVKEIRLLSGPDGVPLTKLIEEGHMLNTKTIGPENRILCQTLIVKRKGLYYLLINESLVKANLGFIKFNPDILESQEVLICPEPAKYGWTAFTMRVVKTSESYEALKELMDDFCTYSL